MVEPAVDVHAHLVAERLPALVRAQPAGSGVAVHDGADGPVFTFPGGVESRPLFRALTDAAGRRRWLAARGLELQLVGPWLDLVGYSLPVRQGARWSRLLNESLAAACSGEPSLVPLATVPLQDGAAAARELRHAVRALGMPGVVVGTRPPDGGLADRDRRALFRAAVELDVPVVLHPLPAHLGGVLDPATNRLVGYPFATCAAFLDLLAGGVFADLPELRLVLPHGGGTLVHQLGRIRRGLEIGDLPAIPARALDRALAGCHFDCAVHSRAELETLLREVPAGRLLLGSDAPFALGLDDPAGTLAAALSDRRALGAVLAGNARRLFRLPVAAATGAP